jgi:ligand-binding sensor protein
MNTATHAPLPVTQAPRADEVVSRLRSSDIFRSYQQAFQTATGLPLVLRTAGSFQKPLHGAKNPGPFCVLMAAKSRSCAACLDLQQRAEADAGGGSVTLECFAGLSESLVPIRLGASVIAYLQTGQVLLHAPTEKQFRATVAQLKKWNVAGDVAAADLGAAGDRGGEEDQADRLVRRAAVGPGDAGDGHGGLDAETAGRALGHLAGT